LANWKWKGDKTVMQKAIKCSKIIAWIGIILNVILLFIIFILYNAYFNASWIATVLNILSMIAVIAEIMTFGGIIVKAILEYRSGVRPTRRDVKLLLLVVAVVVIYYVTQLLIFN
jgi:hypothetical protein